LEHLDKHTLSRYLGGDLPEQELSYCQRHLVGCNSCRRELALLVQILDEDVLPEELAILDTVGTAAPHPGHIAAQPLNLYARFCQWLRPGWKLAVVSASAIMIVAASWTLLFKNSSDTALQLARSERTFEARLAGQPYSEFVRTRTGSVTNNAASGNDELRRLGANHVEMGRFYLQQEEFAKAIAQLEDAKKQKPDAIEICNDLGVAYMESALDGSLEKAVDQFRRALQLNPRYEPALFNLALAYERMGHFSEAGQELRLYLQTDSDSDWAKEVKSKLQLWKR
jgi:tetratricopeptide (TPR) repeat protein